MADAARMIFLGFGKYARADKIYALEPLRGDERGGGRRTRVWVEGVPEPIVASRTERTILSEMGQEAAANVEIVDDAVALARRMVEGAEQGRLDLADLHRRARRLLESTTSPDELAALLTDDSRRHRALPRGDSAGARRPGLPAALLGRLAIDRRCCGRTRPFRWFWLGQARDARRRRSVRSRCRTRSTAHAGRRSRSACSRSSLVPLVTLTLLGGALADAVDRRRLLLWTEVVLAVTGGGLVVNALPREPQVWLLTSRVPRRVVLLARRRRDAVDHAAARRARTS